MDQRHEMGRRRDAGSLKIVGWFFLILGSLVMLGTFWARGNQRAMIVNVCSGALIAVIGIGMVFLSRRLQATLDNGVSETSEI